MPIPRTLVACLCLIFFFVVCSTNPSQTRPRYVFKLFPTCSFCEARVEEAHKRVVILKPEIQEKERQPISREKWKKTWFVQLKNILQSEIASRSANQKPFGIVCLCDLGTRTDESVLSSVGEAVSYILDHPASYVCFFPPQMASTRMTAYELGCIVERKFPAKLDRQFFTVNVGGNVETGYLLRKASVAHAEPDKKRKLVLENEWRAAELWAKKRIAADKCNDLVFMGVRAKDPFCDEEEKDDESADEAEVPEEKEDNAENNKTTSPQKHKGVSQHQKILQRGIPFWESVMKSALQRDAKQPVFEEVLVVSLTVALGDAPVAFVPLLAENKGWSFIGSDPQLQYLAYVQPRLNTAMAESASIFPAPVHSIPVPSPAMDPATLSRLISEKWGTVKANLNYIILKQPSDSSTLPRPQLPCLMEFARSASSSEHGIKDSFAAAESLQQFETIPYEDWSASRSAAGPVSQKVSSAQAKASQKQRRKASDKTADAGGSAAAATPEPASKAAEAEGVPPQRRRRNAKQDAGANEQEETTDAGQQPAADQDAGDHEEAGERAAETDLEELSDILVVQDGRIAVRGLHKFEKWAVIDVFRPDHVKYSRHPRAKHCAQEFKPSFPDAKQRAQRPKTINPIPITQTINL